jgi:hypothetical protein
VHSYAPGITLVWPSEGYRKHIIAASSAPASHIPRQHHTHDFHKSFAKPTVRFPYSTLCSRDHCYVYLPTLLKSLASSVIKAHSSWFVPEAKSYLLLFWSLPRASGPEIDCNIDLRSRVFGKPVSFLPQSFFLRGNFCLL